MFSFLFLLDFKKEYSYNRQVWAAPVIRLQYFHSETGAFTPIGLSWVYKGQHPVIRHFSISMGRSLAHVLWVSRYHVLVITLFPAEKASLSLLALCVAQTWIGQNLRRKLGNDPQCSVATSQQAAGPSTGFPGCQKHRLSLCLSLCAACLPPSWAGLGAR